ncbi:MAG: hypothetical protein RLZZ511_3482 [Cyanobacteriota bacterium]|jgi:uncharacterized protein YecE (DUF72 family)
MDDRAFHLGLAIWGYKGWLGELFPRGSRASDLLPLYTARFSCVEGNTTFYAIPDDRTVARWAAQMPSGFKFCPKLHQSISHQGPLHPRLGAALAFHDRLQVIGDRLGPFMLQLPPRYGPSQFDDLHQFLQGWTAARLATSLAIEVRHRDWFTPKATIQLTALLEDLGLGWALLDSRPIYEGPPSPSLEALPDRQREKKPRLPLQPIVTTDYAIVRYISHPDPERNLSYYRTWVEQIRAWLRQGIQVYFFVHCPIEEHSPRNARAFQAALETAISIPPLGWNQLPVTHAPAAQLDLFEG